MRLLNAVFVAAVVAGGVAVATPAAAQTQFATVTTSLNARSGPGTGYGVVFVMPAGSSVGVYNCATSGWCQVQYGNRTGWASGRYLRIGGAVSGEPAPVTVPTGVVSARVTVQLNMRRGPGTGYGVILAIPAGSSVAVSQCTTGYSWCQVSYAGNSGWVSGTYLQYNQQPIRQIGPRIGISLSFNFGQPAQNARACFYEDWNFGGASFCLQPGDDIAALNTWNDRISSIRLEGGAEVLVCRDFNFGGPCTQYASSVGQLTQWNDTISSIRVRN